MANRLFKETFSGKYNGVTPASVLPPGWVTGGLNMRKIAAMGGWKPRRGCTLHNTTQIAAQPIEGLHYYKNPVGEDTHFIAQCNGNLYDATNMPPTGGTTFGSALISGQVYLGNSISTTAGEYWFFMANQLLRANLRKVLMWGGDTPLVRGFIPFEETDDLYLDQTEAVIDGDSATKAILVVAADDKIYVLTRLRASGLVLDMGTVNANAATLTVKAWRSGAWAAVASMSDGTTTGGATLGQDGTITWTTSALDEMKIIAGVQGFAYQLSWNAGLTAGTSVIAAEYIAVPEDLTNKWDGNWDWVEGCRFYDASTGEYIEHLGSVTSESQATFANLSAAATGDRLYLKTIDPAAAFNFAIADGKGNNNAATLTVNTWDGDSWTVVTQIENLTGADSFAETGVLSLNASGVTGVKRTLEGDTVPGYWYQIIWDVALSDPTEIYAIAYARHPEPLEPMQGCVEFKGRLFLWGSSKYPNRLRYSALNNPDSFSGADAGYTKSFGDLSPIRMVLPFYDKLLVWKDSGLGFLSGSTPADFSVNMISTAVGISSFKSAVIADVGAPSMHADEAVSVAIWQDVDGVYMLDQHKPKKISMPVDQYFNPEYSTAIPAASIANRVGFYDRINNEYHLLLPTSELVYNVVTDEWYPAWERNIDLYTAISFRSSDNRYYTYGGDATGYVYRLENDTADKTVGNTDVAISHSIKSRAIGLGDQSRVSLRFNLRKIWGVFEAITAASPIITKVFKNMATTGVVQSAPAAMDAGSSLFNITVDHVDLSMENTTVFQVEFSSTTADKEMKIWEFLYELEGQGLLDT